MVQTELGLSLYPNFQLLSLAPLGGLGGPLRVRIVTSFRTERLIVCNEGLLAHGKLYNIVPVGLSHLFSMGKPRSHCLLPAKMDRVDSTCRPCPPRSLGSLLGLVAKLLVFWWYKIR